MVEKSFYSLKEIATELDLSRQTLHSHKKNGRLIVTKAYPSDRYGVVLAKDYRAFLRWHKKHAKVHTKRDDNE